jgi:hypothetical protein
MSMILNEIENEYNEDLNKTIIKLKNQIQMISNWKINKEFIEKDIIKLEIENNMLKKKLKKNILDKIKKNSIGIQPID